MSTAVSSSPRSSWSWESDLLGVENTWIDALLAANHNKTGGLLDLDEVEDDHVWWGGMEHDHEQWDQHCSEEHLYSMGWNKGGYKGYPKGGSKGSFNDFKGVGKGDNSKGQGKGGKGSGFNGYCHWCGEWGHSQSRCR